MSVAQTRAARRKYNLRRRKNGPGIPDTAKAQRRLQDKVNSEKARAARGKKS